jgi:hypothetical protein
LGAPFGAHGVRVASWLLVRLRGGSHLDDRPRPAPSDPPWLERYRSPA